MTVYQTTWNLTVESPDAAAHTVALSKLYAGQADRLAQFGEQWTVEDGPEPLTAKASLVLVVDNLDAAG